MQPSIRHGTYAPSVALGQDETLRLSTVGIDIGSATSQLVFSVLTLERRGSRYETVDRAVTYESDVLLTPYTADTTIDADALGKFFAEQYRKAGVHPEDVDTGAVILTGVALDRRNSALIAELLAQQSGRFISVAAGDELEGVLAAHGSGAVAASIGGSVLNVDVGGGTTKLSLCRDGAVAATAALDVGARLLAWDSDGRLHRLERAGRSLAALGGAVAETDTVLRPEHRDRIVEVAVGAVVDAVDGNWSSPAVAELLRTAHFDQPSNVPVVLSGGMTRYLVGPGTPSFGDLGPHLAASLAPLLRARGHEVTVAGASIRATVVGASQFTVQVSGTTIHVSGEPLLPLRNAEVSLVRDRGVGEPPSLAERVAKVLATRVATGPVVLVVPFEGSADHATVDGFCRSVLHGLAAADRARDGLVLVLDSDVAGLIGAHLVEECDYTEPLVVLDGVQLGPFDFVDIGAYLPHSASVPVTVKSLAFRQS
jgi:ethanolamine utilization protein EutA